MLGGGVKKEEIDSGTLEELGEEETSAGHADGGEREWNAELDGAEAVNRKGWAAADEENDDERDFEGEEEEEKELQGAGSAPQDEFDAEAHTEADKVPTPRISGVRAGVKMEEEDGEILRSCDSFC